MIVAGTGHRPNKLGGYSQEAFNKLVNIITNWLKEKPIEKVISGMALGYDQALAQSAINLNIPFIAAIPFKGQESVWPENSQKYYQHLLSKASEVVIVSEGVYSGYKMQIRNEWMVDKCDVVLTIWDKTEGGTGNCIHYANKKGKKIINLYEDYLNDNSI